MARDYTYVSADSHLEIDSRWWRPRVPEQWRDRAPRLVRLSSGGDAWMVENRPLIQNAGDLYGGKGRDVWRARAVTSGARTGRRMKPLRAPAPRNSG
jgi:hypothetical protein